jgi:putative hemolysin
LFPKSLAVQYPERVALATVIPMKVSEWLYWPFIKVFNGSGNLILRLLGLWFTRPRPHPFPGGN